LNCGEGKEGRMLYAPTEGMDSRFRGNDKRGSTRLPYRYAPRNNKKGARLDNNNLLIIAPTSSGKSFIGEMATISRVTHHKKTIYLLPLKSPAEEKYRHFKNLYNSYGSETVISTRNHREEDYRIIRGNYKIAVMAYEKFYYFLLKYSKLLDDVSLVIIDEMHAINNPKWGPLLEDIIEQLHKKDLRNLRIIALSAFIENQKVLLKWFPIQTQTLLSYQYPVKLRKGIVRDGTFKYITSYKKNSCICRKERFFKPKSVRDNCFEDYLLETVRYLVNQGESTLIFFPTCAETRQWTERLVTHLESPVASSALKDLAKMEETLSRDELLKSLEKGIAFYNQDLSWEERNLLETYLKKGEIKIICATTILAMDLNLPFKNVIIPLDKMHNDNDEDYIHNYRTSITFADIENMGGRAGILNIGKQENSTQKRQKFGRVIFLAPSRLSETTSKNLYFEFLKNNNPNNNNNNTPTKHLLKEEENLLTYLLRLLLKYNLKPKKLKKYLKKRNIPSAYWRFIFPKENIDEEINNCLDILKENRLTEEDSNGNLSLTSNGILIAAKGIKVETYLFLKTWINYSKKGEISNLEILYLLSQTSDGKEMPIPFYHTSINDYRKERYKCEQEEIHAEKILHLIFQQNEEDKKLYQTKILLKKCNGDEVFSLEENLSFKKNLLLYDWIKGVKNVKTIEQEYNLYRGAIYRLGEGFSWLADSLAAIAENTGWKKKRKEDLYQIKLLSNRLIEGVREEGLNLANLYIPGLSRYHITKLLHAGYNNSQCLKELSEEDLSKILPDMLAKRIKESFPLAFTNSQLASCTLQPETRNSQPETCNLPPILSSSSTKNYKPKTKDLPSPSLISSPPPCTSQLKTENRQLKTVLQISLLLPDRIIFEGKEVKLTPIAFSLLYLLAQNPKEVLIYDYLINTIWKGSRDATYTQITFHLSKIRRAILKTICYNKKNRKKVKEIFKVVSRRGIMLNLEEDKLKIN
jgi:helicase